MAGSASNWYKPTSGPLKGQAVYVSKTDRMRADGTVLGTQDVLRGLAAGAITESKRPAGVAKTKASPAEIHAQAAMELAHVIRDQRKLGLTDPNYQIKSAPMINEKNRLHAIMSDNPAAQTNSLPEVGEKLRERKQKNTILFHRKFVLDTFKELGDSLTRDQSEAMRRYIKHSYQVNNGLRTGNLENSPPMNVPTGSLTVGPMFEKPRDVRHEVDQLDSMVRTIPKEAEISMYRGLDARVLGDIEIGTQLRDKGFMSLGFDLNEASTYAEIGLEGVDAYTPTDTTRLPAVMRVNLREGTRVVPTIEYYSQSSPRGDVQAHPEILMDRGTTLEITGITVEGRLLIIDTEVVNQRSG